MTSHQPGSQPDPTSPTSSAFRAIDRRKFLGLAGVGVGALALAACGGPSTSNPAPTTTPAAGTSPATGAGPAAGGTGPTGGATTSAAGAGGFDGVTPAATITYWTSHPGASQDVEQQIIDAFNASGAGIKVTMVTAGASYEDIAQKFQAAQAAGASQLPDVVVFSDVWWFRYYMQKSITALDDLNKAVGIDPSTYVAALFNDYQYQGQQWAVPFARSTPLFYYNKDHWTKAGLPDRAPQTWQEFHDWAPKLQSAGTGVQHAFQLPALAGYAGWSLQNNLWGWGGGWSQKDSFTISTDAQETIDALQFLQDMVYQDKIAGVAATNAINDMAAGAVSATVSSTGDLVGVQKAAQGKFEVGVGFLPGGPKASDLVCPTGGAGLGIPAAIGKERQLAAAKFIAFMTNPANTVSFAKATGYMPVRTDADTAGLIAANPLAGTAINQLPHTRSQDWARVFLPGADQEMAKSCATILTSQGNVKDAMVALRSTLQNIYDTQVKPNIS